MIHNQLRLGQVCDSTDNGREAGDRRENLRLRASEKGTLLRAQLITIISSITIRQGVFRYLLSHRSY